MFSIFLLASVAASSAEFSLQADRRTQSASQPRLDTPSRRILAAHNNYRASVGVPPLAWDHQLAAAASRYASQMGRTGSLVHSPRGSRPGQSENLWMGTGGAYTPEAMVGAWGAERAQFRSGVFPNVSTTGNWLDVSHYTQMIWRGTTHVGCAIYRARSHDYLVCRYSPRGNRDGQRVP